MLAELRAIVGGDAVLSDRDELKVYECDGFPIARGLPTAVVLPTTTQQVAACVAVLARHDAPIIPRGSGTGLTGACVAFGEGVIVCTSRMTTIELIDTANRVAVVQAGVPNLALSAAVIDACRRDGLDVDLHFSPDPSSQRASTIGGNAATNAGGINTLKHGVTTNHILGVEVVLADGSVHTTGAAAMYDRLGADLPGLFCGSEGTLGLITRLWCRLAPKPAHFRTIYAVFDSTADACRTVTDIIAAGIVPASMEMMDGRMIRVVEDAFHYGFPTHAQALLLIEIDGVDAVLDEQLSHIVIIARENRAFDVQHCSDPHKRAELWSARKKAFGAIGRISHGYCTQDACVPRSKLPEAMAHINALGEKYGMTITSVFHAGDGNVHPILLFNEDDTAQVQKTLRLSEDILDYCISIGGTITGEHGVGVEKIHLMHRMFNEATLAAFSTLKRSLDPELRLNDGKLIPSPRTRIELLRPIGANTPGGAL
jgi:glycolate oxidase